MFLRCVIDIASVTKHRVDAVYVHAQMNAQSCGIYAAVNTKSQAKLLEPQRKLPMIFGK